MENNTCNHCDETLVVGSNWRPSRVKKYDYTCNRCGGSTDPVYKKARKIFARGKWRQPGEQIDGITARFFKGIAYDFWLHKKHLPNDYHVDHIIPLASGGCNCPGNTQLMTAAAHREKTKAEAVWVWLHKEVYGDAT